MLPFTGDAVQTGAGQRLGRDLAPGERGGGIDGREAIQFGHGGASCPRTTFPAGIETRFTRFTRP